MRHVTKQDTYLHIFVLMNLQQAKIFELIKEDCLTGKKILRYPGDVIVPLSRTSSKLQSIMEKIKFILIHM